MTVSLQSRHGAWLGVMVLNHSARCFIHIAILWTGLYALNDQNEIFSILLNLFVVVHGIMSLSFVWPENPGARTEL